MVVRVAAHRLWQRLGKHSQVETACAHVRPAKPIISIAEPSMLMANT